MNIDVKYLINDELEIQIEAMKVCFDNNLQKKWNKSKINQKNSNIKLMKDKLTQKDEEMQM